MNIVADSLDDLMNKSLQRIIKKGYSISPSKGDALELTGVLLTLKNPRMRVSQSVARGVLTSCLGELLWYLAGSNRLDYIKYYIGLYGKSSDDRKTIYGAYGPRIFGDPPFDQITRVISTLKSKQESRQAVVQIFDAKDTVEFHSDIPCTCTMQFFIRKGLLHMSTTMRSNDVFVGLPHDIFAFTMIQELVARSLDLELGEYKHYVGSLHLYETNSVDAQKFLNEGWQSTIPMPSMPQGDPWIQVKRLLGDEKKIRKGKFSELDLSQYDSYWLDFVLLLKAHWLFKYQPSDLTESVKRLKRRLSCKTYHPFINRKESKRRPLNQQFDLFIEG